MVHSVSGSFYDIQFIKPYWVAYKCSFEELNSLPLLKRKTLDHFHSYDDALNYIKALDDELAYK